ncbi:hypothetical protein AB1Y20_000400 [Prymnesium parvum]|uniref:Peroxin-14 n=1 Tax=Prymnesium parvum TaxID=97485 RepID=A0AB34K8D2_PRYPA
MAFRAGISRGLGSAAGISVIGYQALPNSWRSSSLDEFIASLLNSATAQLKGLSSSPSASGLAAPAQSAELSGLLLSQQALSRTIEHLLSVQARSNTRAALGWLLPAGVVAALVGAWYKWGWEGFGWVSLEQLSEGLESVKHTLGEKILQLKEEVMLRFSQVEEAIRKSSERLQNVDQGVSELREQAERSNSMMSSLESRLGSVERNTHRSARGVELLVHLVSASNLFADADDTSLTMLREFTGALPAPTSTSLSSQRIAPQPLERSTSSFVQMLLSPQLATP